MGRFSSFIRWGSCALPRRRRLRVDSLRRKLAASASPTTVNGPRCRMRVGQRAIIDQTYGRQDQRKPSLRRIHQLPPMQPSRFRRRLCAHGAGNWLRNTAPLRDPLTRIA